MIIRCHCGINNCSYCILELIWKYKETYKCKECGEEFDVPGRTIDVLSHDTEYLRDCDVDKIE